MAGLSSLNTKILKLSRVSVEKVRGLQVSVVRYSTDENGDQVLHWPHNPNDTGVLLVPELLSLKQWAEKYGEAGDY